MQQHSCDVSYRLLRRQLGDAVYTGGPVALPLPPACADVVPFSLPMSLCRFAFPDVPKLHIFCKGPKTAGKATIVMEGGGGSPGVSYAPIVDALAAAGRRACWYDRLGYGWSDDIIKPTTTMRVRLQTGLFIALAGCVAN